MCSFTTKLHKRSRSRSWTRSSTSTLTPKHPHEHAKLPPVRVSLFSPHACLLACLLRSPPALALRCVPAICYPHARLHGSRMPTLTPHARSRQPLLFFRRPNAAALPDAYSRRRARGPIGRLQHRPRHRHRREWKTRPGQLLLAGTRRRGGGRGRSGQWRGCRHGVT